MSITVVCNAVGEYTRLVGAHGFKGALVLLGRSNILVSLFIDLSTDMLVGGGNVVEGGCMGYKVQLSLVTYWRDTCLQIPSEPVN